MFAEDYWLTALVFAAPIAAVLAGRLAWSARCARTRRGACRIWQFGCRELLVLFTLLCVAFGGISLAKRYNGESALHPSQWEWPFQFGNPYCIALLPGTVVIAWGIPVLIVACQFGWEWLLERRHAKPRPRPLVTFEWLAEPNLTDESPAKVGHSTTLYERID